MAKKIALVLIFVFIILPIIIIGILGADIYLTLTSFSPSKVSFSATTPQLSLSSDNQSIIIKMNVTLKTPPAGFLPKTITAKVTLYDNNSMQLGKPIVFTLTLGKTSTNDINQPVPLSQTLIQEVALGHSISITVKTRATIALLGITIPYTFKVPDETITV